jgi:putative ABC transport system substrate-binding protein
VRRRQFIKLIGGAGLLPCILRAETVRSIGVLMGFRENDPASQSLVAEFRTELANLGWKEAGDLRIEVRWGAGDVDRIGTLAKELVDLRPNVILAQTTPVAKALARETKTIPIVFVTVSDPIGSGLAESLNRPRGNITGFTFVESAMGGKWVEFLKEMAPSTSLMALLFNPTTAPPLKFYMPSIEAAASSFAVQASVAAVHAERDIEGVVAAQASKPGGSLIVMPDAFNATHQKLIISLVAHYKVPAIYGNNFTKSGALIYYGPDFAETFRLGAGYVDRILKGAKPGELPIQLPTKFALAINVKTAETLGLSVPQSLLARADEVIE